MNVPERILEPCPCCGGVAAIDQNLCDVHCTNCGLTTGVRFRLSMAVVVWNTRVDTVELVPGSHAGRPANSTVIGVEK